MSEHVTDCGFPLRKEMLDALDDLFFVFTPEGSILVWNRRVNEVTGYSDEEIAAMKPVEFVPQTYRPLLRRKIQEVLREGTARLEAMFVGKAGRRIPYEFSGSRLMHEGEPLICGTGRDISERKQAEQAVHQSAEKYHRLFRDSQEGIVISTPEGRLLDANPAAEEILGYSKEELVDLMVEELYVNSEDRRRGRRELLRTGAVRNLEVRIRRKDGEEIICQLSSTPQHTPTGDIELFQTFFRDITRQKHAQEALKASEEKFRRLFEESRDAIILTTPGGDITDVNSSAEQLFGYSRDEFVRLRAKQLYARPEERKQRIVPALLRSNSSRVLEAWMRHSDGHEFLASASVTVHRDDEGQPELIQALVRDITRQRRLEEQLVKIQEQERRRIGQELHDGIASQLTGITMIAEGHTRDLREGGSLSPDEMNEVTELLRDATKQTRRLSRGLNPVQVGKNGLPGALDKLVRRTTKQTGLSCSADVDDTLPEIDDQAATHLYRIAQEATNNAIKHAGAANIEIQLTVDTEQLLLEVRDDGRGISGKDASSDGLGLQTMRYRSDIIGGSLDVTPLPEGGTRVRCAVTI